MSKIVEVDGIKYTVCRGEDDAKDFYEISGLCQRGPVVFFDPPPIEFEGVAEREKPKGHDLQLLLAIIAGGCCVWLCCYCLGG